MADERTTWDEPHDRLTRIAAHVGSTLEAAPDYRPGDRSIVFVSDHDRSGIGLFNYDDQTEAMTDLLMHLQAIFRSVGKRMDIAFLNEDGVTRIDGDG